MGTLPVAPIAEHVYEPGQDSGACLFPAPDSLNVCGHSRERHRIFKTDTLVGAPALAAWDAFSEQVRHTIVRKSAGYGNAWQAQGYMGNVARILSKVSRLKNLMWREAPVTDHDIDGGEEESIVDNAIDLAALASFLVYNVEGKNRWGN